MPLRRHILRGSIAAFTVILAAACALGTATSDPIPSSSSTSAPIGAGPTDGVTRAELQRFPSPAKGWEIVQTLVEIPEGKESGRHSHPGPEIGYIIQGDVSIEFDDRPALRLRSGEPFNIPPNVVHNARNVGKVRTKMLSSYLIEEGKPLVHMH
ncbi:cupin domain-containing protein [Crossiella cryophila]|uniref:Quercetin dioxygenase-like cupin family protein n=1 Tax=Crossiella cryophila TaxID=43355 RepID=A0A7W7FW69_9PSEU|nr:cupin domain-containing protein [Crossiella cryophila]MBB4679957.1 quercetin dioxygenase-like cupin family protein [Crossiella cryophila]